MCAEEKSVLIVDDEPFIRQSFVDYFEDRLWRVMSSESGEEALEMLEKESPRGAIVDIRLRGMDGDTFIRNAAKVRSNMVFLICTGSPEYGIPDDLLEMSGVSSHIFWKPVTNIAELEEHLAQMIFNLHAEQE